MPTKGSLVARNTHFVVWSACKARIWVRVRVNAVWTVCSVLVAADSCRFMQADIYSLGVLLWEIVTSDVPERGRMRPVKVCSLLLIACLLSASSVVIAQGICQNPPAFSLYKNSSFTSMNVTHRLMPMYCCIIQGFHNCLHVPARRVLANTRTLAPCMFFLPAVNVYHQYLYVLCVLHLEVCCNATP